MRSVPLRLETLELPIIPMAAFVGGERTSGVMDDCLLAADQMHTLGLGIFLDPRFDITERPHFFSMLQRYFAQDRETIARDVRNFPDRVVGVAMLFQEHARDHSARIAAMAEHHRPHTTEADRRRGDPKYRYHWRVAHPDVRQRMIGTPALEELLADQLVPDGFPEWAKVMDQRGNALITTIFDATRMVALGLGLDEDTFVDTMTYGTNLFAPTGTDLANMDPGDVLAGFHYDFGQWTGHDSASHDGLIAWTRDGRPFKVRVPPGCVLIQCGKEAEILTGGYLVAGFHEVVAMPVAVEQARRDAAAGLSSFRVAGPLFAQSGKGVILSPRGRFATREALTAYPPILSERHQSDEIAAMWSNL